MSSSFSIQDLNADGSTFNNVGLGGIQSNQTINSGIATIHEGNHFDAPGSTFNVTMVERESSPAIFNIHPAINKDSMLDKLPYALNAGYQSEKGCLPGTRQTVLDFLMKWAFGTVGPMMLWLTGCVGVGKTAILHTFARMLKDKDGLGCSYFFDRNDQQMRRPNNLFSTIARDVVRLDPLRKRALHDIISNDRSLRTSLSPLRQFEELFVKPEWPAQSAFPVVVIIDALDECAVDETHTAERNTILTILGDPAMMSRLPSYVRVVVASRPTQDIETAFNRKSHIGIERMQDIDPLSTQADILTMVRHHLPRIQALDDRWPNELWQRMLVDMSDGHFLLASMACSIIKGSNHHRHPVTLFEDVLSSNANIYHVFSAILSDTFDERDNRALKAFETILGRLLVAEEPLTLETLRGLAQAGDIDFVMPHVGTLISGGYGSDLIRPLHSTLYQFLAEKDSSKSFYVDPTTANQDMCLACFHCMKDGLRFNIGGLETSYYLRGDPMSDSITQPLVYACRFWAQHLRKVEFTPEIHTAVHDFLHEVLLFWLEALSCLQEMKQANPALVIAANWSRPHDHSLATFAVDASRLISVFGGPIAQNPSQIYLSALAFSPKNSFVARHYGPLYPNKISFVSGQCEFWPSEQMSIAGHDHVSSSVAFSPDGNYVASASYDTTVRVWDAITGEATSEPFRGHFKRVTSLSFSKDGRRLISGSADGTIRVRHVYNGDLCCEPIDVSASSVNSVAVSHDDLYIAGGCSDHSIVVFDAHTGRRMSPPFQGHRKSVNSVSFSPDGRKIVSGSSDTTIQLWDAMSGRLCLEPIRRHSSSVQSVIFSPDGDRIVSGSRDMSVVVCSAVTGTLIAGPFHGHSDTVTCVAFSPANQHIVSISLDMTVLVRDALTGDVVSGPFRHNSPGNAVAYSWDGRRIVSGYCDGSLKLWDAAIGQADYETHVGHSMGISAVAISPDGLEIATGSDDATIIIWENRTGEPIVGPFLGHNENIRAISYSPDGQHIASGSDDTTIRLWNTETGLLSCAPLTGHDAEVLFVAFSPDGYRLISGSQNKILIYEVQSSQISFCWVPEAHQYIDALAYSKDGRRMAFSLERGISIYTEERNIIILDTETGHTVCSFVEQCRGEARLALSSHGDRLVLGSEDMNLKVWDATKGILLESLVAEDGVRCISISSDDRHIAAGGLDNRLRVWDMATCELVYGPFAGHLAAITSVLVARHTGEIVSGSEDGAVRVWERLTNDMPREYGGANGLLHMNTNYGTHTSRLSLVGQTYDLNNRISDHNPVVDMENDSCLLENGWMTSHSYPLFWVPKWHRLGLCRPQNRMVISKETTVLNLDRFAHGRTWEACRGQNAPPS